MCRTAWRRRSPICRQMSTSTGSRRGSPPACPCSSFQSFRPTTRTMRSSSPTTPPLTSPTSSTACRVWGRCGCSGPAITPCASGSSRMCCPTSPGRSNSRAPSTPRARWAQRQHPRALRRRTRSARRGGSRHRRSLARSSCAPTRTAPSCACETWPGSNWVPSTISSARAKTATPPPPAAIAIFKFPGSNALATADGVKRVLADLKSRFPADLDYAVTLDTTLPVTEGIREIVQTLFEAMLLVIFVVFIFLQNWRATLIPLIAVPVSLIGTFAVFPLLGFSINTLSLFAFVLAIGLVVDDAIVVVEAVEQHIERGLAPREATVQAMQEVSGPVVAIALILSSVFLPVAFMGGIQGRLNNQFAVTIVVSMLISAFNALTLSPALAALLLRPRQTSRGLLGAFYGGFNRGFDKVMQGYVDGSHFLMRKVVVGILILAGFY